MVKAHPSWNMPASKTPPKSLEHLDNSRERTLHSTPPPKGTGGDSSQIVISALKWLRDPNSVPVFHFVNEVFCDKLPFPRFSLLDMMKADSCAYTCCFLANNISDFWHISNDVMFGKKIILKCWCFSYPSALIMSTEMSKCPYIFLPLLLTRICIHQ